VTVLLTYSKEIASLASPIIAWVLATYLGRRVKLLLDYRHAFNFLLQVPTRAPDGTVINPTTMVRTASVSVFNNGRAPATKVEVVFNWQPQHFNIWPSRHYEVKLSPDRRFSVFFENLAAKEVVGFELLAVNADLPEILSVRSEQGLAHRRALVPWPVPPMWRVRAIQVLAGFGIAALVYLAFSAVQLLVR
jgi:hypothetical protein